MCFKFLPKSDTYTVEYVREIREFHRKLGRCCSCTNILTHRKECLIVLIFIKNAMLLAGSGQVTLNHTQGPFNSTLSVTGWEKRPEREQKGWFAPGTEIFFFFTGTFKTKYTNLSAFPVFLKEKQRNNFSWLFLALCFKLSSFLKSYLEKTITYSAVNIFWPFHHPLLI